MTADPEQLNAVGARISMTLPPLGQAAGLARHAVRVALGCWGLDHLAENATLLVSEVVGNAIRHASAGGSALELELAAVGELLRIEVLDADPRAPTLRDPGDGDEGGFGLVVVQALADAWGVRPTASGKAVWFELRTAQPAKRGVDPARDGNRNSVEKDMSGDRPMPSASRDSAGDLDPRRPNVARMFDYYLGGKDNFAADRQAAEKVLAAAPDVPLAALENRQFLTQAIQYVTEHAGIQQFIDIGPGLPTRTNVHHIAHRFSKAARIAYVDYDPAVVSHGQALLARDHPAVTMTEGDLREPEKVLADAELRRIIDLGQPVALCLTLVLHFIPDFEHPQDMVARLVDALAPGSRVIISHVTGDGKDREVVEQVTRTYDGATAPLVMRSREDVRRLFGECAVVPPGVVYLTQWCQHTAATPVPGDGGTRWAYGGVGIK